MPTLPFCILGLGVIYVVFMAILEELSLKTFFSLAVVGIAILAVALLPIVKPVSIRVIYMTSNSCVWARQRADASGTRMLSSKSEIR